MLRLLLAFAAVAVLIVFALSGLLASTGSASGDFCDSVSERDEAVAFVLEEEAPERAVCS